MLPLALVHDAGFVMIDQKTFFQSDRGDQHYQALGFAAEIRISREREIVSVARVGGTHRLRSAGEARVEPI